MSEQPAVRILAVDDIESNLVALEAVLQDSSISVVRAQSGQDALRALLEEDFALILLDVQMPEMDGFETASAIRQRKKSSRTPIIFLTAHGSSTEKAARAYAVGAVDFMAKPFDEDALRAKVAAIADLWRKLDETKRQGAAEAERQLAEERQRWETESLRARVAEQERAMAVEHAARLQAEHASRIKDEFLATLSHELRSPLNAILGWATTLQRKGVNDPTTKRGLDAIERNARAQAALIEDLLDATSIMAGNVQLNVQAVNVAEVVDLALEAIRPMAARKTVALTATADSDLPAMRGDPRRLAQVVEHVLSNAVKFSADGGRIELRVQKLGSRLHIRVADSGVGISAELLPHVFDRFRQGDGARTRAHGGLGIGLSLAHHLMTLHGGAIRAESDGPGHGATFTIILPVPAIAAFPVAAGAQQVGAAVSRWRGSGRWWWTMNPTPGTW